MAPKHSGEASDSASSKKRKTITMEQKVDIIKRSEKGETPTNIGKALGFSRSTIGTIIKDKARIMEHVKGSAPMHATVITKQRKGLLIEMERLLEKAWSIFNDLKAAIEEAGTECDEEFAASHGWFNRFKNRANYHNINLHGEAASSDQDAASSFPAEFEKIVKDGGYSLDQVFNVDETGLFWKKMPTRTYIVKEEKSAPGHKHGKDRLSLLLGGNASGDCKLKPMLIYRSNNPRVFGQKGVIKASLPVYWKHNKTAWCSRPIFLDWFLNHFIPEVERYCNLKGIPFKILLCIDNAPGHPKTLDDLHPNVNVVFLPKNTTPLIQPMDQGVIASFKAYYLRTTFAQAVWATEDGVLSLKDWWRGFNIYEAVKNIGSAWDEVKDTNMRGVWKKLLPSYATDLAGFSEDDILQARQNVVNFGQRLNLEIDEDDVIDLLESHHEELTNEDLMELERQMQDTDQAEDIDNPEPKPCAMAKFEEQDPNEERFMKAYRGVYSSVACYQALYDERKQATHQSTLDAFFTRTPRPTTPSLPVAGPSSARPRHSSLVPGSSSPLPAMSPASSTSDY